MISPPCTACGAAIDCPPEDAFAYTLTGSEQLPYFFLCPSGTCRPAPGQTGTITLVCCEHQLTRQITSSTTDAQLAALVASMQQECAQYAGQCTDPPTGPPVNPITIYFNSPQSCASLCPGGIPFIYTVSGGLFIALSQSAADLAARNSACRQVQQFIVCMSDLPPECCAGSAYSQAITGSGLPCGMVSVNDWEIVSGTVPPGLVVPTGLQGCSITITGTPTTVGTYTFTLSVRSPGGAFMQRAYTICVVGISASPAGSDASHLPDGTSGTAYANTLSAGACALPALEWGISSGTLPPGLTLDTNTGVISGTPTTPGSYTFTVQVTTQVT